MLKQGLLSLTLLLVALAASATKVFAQAPGAPTLTGAIANGDNVILTYNEALSATTAAAAAFRLTQDGSLVPVTDAVVSGSTVEISLAWPVTGGRSLAISYSDPSSGDDANAIQSLSGVDAASLTNASVTNLMADPIPPVFQYAATSPDGSKLILTFSKPLSATLPTAAAFSVSVAGEAATVTNVAENGDTLELTLPTPITTGQAVTVSYSDGSDADLASAIQDINGNDAAAFSEESVRNTVGTHVYYISPTGSDTTGDGSVANPFATLSKVHGLSGAAALGAGDTVYFLEGTYRNSNFGDGNIWKDSLSDFVLLLNRSGTAGNPITYAAAPGARVVLEFDGPGAIRFQSAQHVNFHGFEVKGQNGSISLEEALAHQFEYRIDTDSDGSYLDEVSWFRPTTPLVPGTTVLGKKPDGTDYVMPANKTLSSLGAKTPGSFGANAIVIAGSSNHIQILNNTVHDAPGAGISSLTGADYVLIRGNDFYNNNWFTPSGTHAISFKYLSSSDTFTGAKVIVDGNTFSDNYSRLISWAPLQNDEVDMVVDEGKTLHVQNSTSESGWTHGQVLFINNLIVRSGNAAITVNNAERIVMANNTIIDSGYLNRLIELGLVDPNMHEGFQVAASGFRLGGTSLTVINNLISSSTGQTINGVLKPLNVVDATAAVTGSGTGASLFADNLYFNGTVFLRTTTGNAALDAGFIAVNTVEEFGFTDPDKGNYFLLRASPAVNQGDTSTTDVALVLPEDLTGHVRDGLIDLGAFEFVGDALPPDAGTLSVSGKDNDLDDSFSLVLSGQEVGSTVVLQRSDDAGTTWADTVADQTGLAPGSYAYRAQVSDAAGNTSYSAVVDVTVANPYASPDTTPPAAPVITAIADDVASNTLASSGDISDDATPTLAITAAPGSVVRVYDSGILLGTATETATVGSFTFTTPTLPVGGHSFTARASDANGNLSDASAAYAMSVGVTGSILHGGLTYNMAFTVVDKDNLADDTYTLVATGQAAGDTVQYRQSPNGTSSWGGMGSGPSPFTQEDSEASGTYYYQARVDFDGGTGYDWTSPTLTVTVDTAAAVASIDTTAPSKPTLVSSVPSSEGQVLTLTLAAEAGSTVVIFDGSTPLGLATEGGSGTFTFTTGTLASGTHPLSWRAIDAAGNASDLSATLVHTVASNSNNNAPTGIVTITGTPTQGQTLTAANTLADSDGIPVSGSGAIAYQWKADGSAISGATSSSYVLTQAEVGKTITVTATYTDNGGTVESATSAATDIVANVNDSPTGTVTISGTPTQGQTLTASNDVADLDGIPASGPNAISYQWKGDGTVISGATGSSYVLTQAEVGKAITVTATYTDNGGQEESVTSSPTDSVVSANGAPSDLALSAASVAENAAVGTTVGSLSTTDLNPDDAFTYALVSGQVAALGLPIAVPDASETQSEMIVSARASSVPLSSIALDLDITHTWRGDLVVTLQAPSGEIITISDRNAGSTGDREDLVISAVALNSAQFGGNNSSVNPNGTWILRVVDAAADDVGTLNSWALRFTDGVDNSSFTIDGNTLKTAEVFDFEAKSSYDIRVRSTDDGGLSAEKSFTVSVTNVNEAPTDLFLSATSVAADASVGTSVGSVSTTDPDAGDTFTYAFATGAGDTDNASFTLDGSTIKTDTVFDVQTKNSYNIRVRSTDAGGLSTEKALTIRVIDQVASEADIPFALDSDGDGLANIIDTDDDNDGVLDNDDGQPLNAASSGPLTESVTVVTSADAPLLGNSTSNANTNYGSAATAQTRNGFRGLLMKFSLPADGVLQSVTLKLYTSTENDPLDVYLVADNSWTEGGVTFNNANWENSVFLGTTGSPSGGVYSYTLPQNAALAAGQTVSLYVEDPDDPNGSVEALFTKETAGKAPSLLIEKSDVSPLEITVSNQEVYRTDGSFTVNISMRSAPSGTVYVPLVVSDPSVASIVGASVLTFTAANWASPQTIQITATDVGDFTLVVRPLHSDDSNFNGLNPDDVTGFKVTAIDLAAGTAVTATTGEILSQNLQPTSAVGSTSFRWKLLSGPEGLNVVENTGRLTFRPTSDQAGLNTTAVLQGTDEFGNTASFEIPVTVSSGVNPDPVGVYVVPGAGSDSTGDGTAANPYGTIAYGIERADATGKSAVFIRGGEYSFGSSQQAIATAASSEIVVKPLPGEHAKLNFSGFTGFDITSTARNITLEGLEIDGGSDSANFWDIVSVGFWTPDLISRGGGIAFNIDGQFITIRDNYIHDAYQKAVEIKDGRYVVVDGNIIRNIATTSLSGGHGIMRQQKGAEFTDDDLSDVLRWDITGNMIFNVEQRIYSWVPSKGFIEMVLDEGKPILIDDPKDTDGSQEEMAARISHNIVAYGAIDGIRLKSTPNLEVSHNSVFSQALLADGVTDRYGDTSTPKFTNFKFTNNAVKVTASRFAVEIDDALADAGAGAVVSGNVVGGGQLKPSGRSGITNLGNVDLFTDAINGDFSINPALGLSEVGVAPAILSELDARAEAFGVQIGWDRWEVDHLKLTQTILDNIPGVNDGVAGNEIAFTDQGTFNTARTTIYFSTVNGAWKTDRGAASTMDFHLNGDYSAWYKSIENNFKQAGGSNYSRIRWGDSVLAQDQVLAADGLLVSKVHGSGSSTQITADGRTVTLDGDLLVDLTDYDPANGSSFDLIVAGQLASAFDDVRITQQPESNFSVQVNQVDTDADSVADTLRLTVIDDSPPATPEISVSGSPVAVATTYGTPSAPTTFSVSGASMTAGITVTPPAGFEVSTAEGTGYGASTVVGSSGTIGATTVYVRLRADAAAGSYSGNIVLTSSGANSVNVAIASSTVAAASLPAPEWDGGDIINSNGVAGFAFDYSGIDSNGISVAYSSTNKPTNAGFYRVVATSADANYTGSATNDFFVSGVVAASDALSKPAGTNSFKIPVADLLGNDRFIATDGSVLTNGLAVTAATSASGTQPALLGSPASFVRFYPQSTSAEVFTYTATYGTNSATATATLTPSATAPLNVAIQAVGDAVFDGDQTAVTHWFISRPNRNLQFEYTHDLGQPWKGHTQGGFGSSVNTGNGVFTITVRESGNKTGEWQQMFFRATEVPAP